MRQLLHQRRTDAWPAGSLPGGRAPCLIDLRQELLRASAERGRRAERDGPLELDDGRVAARRSPRADSRGSSARPGSAGTLRSAGRAARTTPRDCPCRSARQRPRPAPPGRSGPLGRLAGRASRPSAGAPRSAGASPRSSRLFVETGTKIGYPPWKYCGMQEVVGARSRAACPGRPSSPARAPRRHPGRTRPRAARAPGRAGRPDPSGAVGRAARARECSRAASLANACLICGRVRRVERPAERRLAGKRCRLRGRLARRERHADHGSGGDDGDHRNRDADPERGEHVYARR